MNRVQHYARQLSFWQLIKEVKIEIPKIQRDYAQGRDDKLKIRNKFLQAIRNALTGNPIQLDFIYGSKYNGNLQPLDGQQRLTTLFLLHWYIATKENVIDNQVKNILKRFTYETRITSREFCEKLVENDINFSFNDNSISQKIKKEPWFFQVWEKDPTVNAMLIMLDDIHNYFNDLQEGWNQLTNEENRPITFQYIELEDLDLSDDLYIKMNARGKILSSFENFKASFENKIEKKQWENNIADLRNTFAHKADTSWTNLFWKISRDNELNFDKAYTNYIANIAMTSIAQYENFENRENIIQELFNNPQEVEPDYFDEKAYKYLYNSLDQYSNEYKYEISFPLWRLNPENEYLLSIIVNTDKQATYPQRILFYAQTKYLLNTDNFDKESFEIWMRVVRNIILNSTIDTPETFRGAILLISELSAGSENIYEYLSQTPIKSKFARKQVQEEAKKAEIITNNKANSNAIFETEDTEFCKGRINFPLYCINSEEDTSNFDSGELNKIKKVLKDHLNGNDISNKFRSALLTIGDHQFYDYWQSWLHAVDAHKRKLIENMDDLRNFAYKPNYRDYLKELISQLINKTIDDIINDFSIPADMPNWKGRLIKEPELLDYSERHYIAIPDDRSCCYLLPKTRVANNEEGRNRVMKIL